MHHCNACQRLLPDRDFPSNGARGRARTCAVCSNDVRRLRAPLPALSRDPEQIKINNAFILWHGPVNRELLRSAA